MQRYEMSCAQVMDVARMRNDGLAWSLIAHEYGVSVGTLRAAYRRHNEAYWTGHNA